MYTCIYLRNISLHEEVVGKNGRGTLIWKPIANPAIVFNVQDLGGSFNFLVFIGIVVHETITSGSSDISRRQAKLMAVPRMFLNLEYY